VHSSSANQSTPEHEDKHLNSLELHRLTLYKWRYTLESLGFLELAGARADVPEVAARHLGGTRLTRVAGLMPGACLLGGARDRQRRLAIRPNSALDAPL
jgi:hypothetical protein